MNKLNLLSKLAIAGVAGVTTAVNLVTAPAQAIEITPGSSLSWSDGTTIFYGQVNDDPGNTIVFDHNNTGAVTNNPLGDFAEWFPSAPFFVDFNFSGNASQLTATLVEGDPLPGTPNGDTVAYFYQEDVVFDFSDALLDVEGAPSQLLYVIPGSPGTSVPGLDVTQVIRDSFTDTGVQFSLCLDTCDMQAYWLADGMRTDSTNTHDFTDELGSSGGVYGIISITKGVSVPEPGTIVGLLAISGLGLGLKRKKQS